MLFHCCSSFFFFFSSDFRQSHSAVLLFSFLLPFFHALLDVVVHFLMLLRFFGFKPFFSQFSPSVSQIKNFCSDPGLLLLMMFAKDLTGCFSHCCVEGGDH